MEQSLELVRILGETGYGEYRADKRLPPEFFMLDRRAVDILVSENLESIDCEDRIVWTFLVDHRRAGNECYEVNRGDDGQIEDEPRLVWPEENQCQCGPENEIHTDENSQYFRRAFRREVRGWGPDEEDDCAQRPDHEGAAGEMDEKRLQLADRE